MISDPPVHPPLRLQTGLVVARFGMGLYQSGPPLNSRNANEPTERPNGMATTATHRKDVLKGSREGARLSPFPLSPVSSPAPSTSRSAGNDIRPPPSAPCRDTVGEESPTTALLHPLFIPPFHLWRTTSVSTSFSRFSLHPAHCPVLLPSALPTPPPPSTDHSLSPHPFSCAWLWLSSQSRRCWCARLGVGGWLARGRPQIRLPPQPRRRPPPPPLLPLVPPLLLCRHGGGRA